MNGDLRRLTKALLSPRKRTATSGAKAQRKSPTSILIEVLDLVGQVTDGAA